MTNFVEELRWRGLLHDIMPDTEAHLLEHATAGYIGFDPTADSLHIGSLVQILILKHFQNAGHKPIALVGGATGLIGDPSFKADERKLNSPEVIAGWADKIKAQVSQFIDFDCGDNAAIVANNLDWTAELSALDFLRDVAGLKGTHAGCEHGVCGACTVLLDGEAVRSCLILAAQAEGSEITTIEAVDGTARQPGELSVIQDAFCEAHGLQCGYCTPGMVLAAKTLLQHNPTPSREQVREAISGNMCRCTGYVQIIDAIMLAAERLQGRNQPADGA